MDKLKRWQRPTQKIFKYFESIEVINKYLIKALNQIGWLSKKTFRSGDTNLIKLKSKTLHSNITKFNVNKIQFSLNVKGVGKQVYTFSLVGLKNKVLLEIETYVLFKEEMSLKNQKNNSTIIKNSFKKNVVDIDGLIRDLLEEDGYKSFW